MKMFQNSIIKLPASETFRLVKIPHILTDQFEIIKNYDLIVCLDNINNIKNNLRNRLKMKGLAGVLPQALLSSTFKRLSTS